MRGAIFDGIGLLPHFSPDLDRHGAVLPASVAAFHRKVEAADGILIACPEYAHSIPGAFKNALDWLVGSTGFPGKPVAILNVSAHAQYANEQLHEVLATMSARIVSGSCRRVPIPDLPDQLDDLAFRTALQEILGNFAAAISGAKSEIRCSGQ